MTTGSSPVWERLGKGLMVTTLSHRQPRSEGFHLSNKVIHGISGWERKGMLLPVNMQAFPKRGGRKVRQTACRLLLAQGERAIFGGFHQLAFARPLVIKAAEMEDAVNDNTM